MDRILSYNDFINEATIRDLVGLYRGKIGDFDVTPKGLQYRTKTFLFDVKGDTGEYVCQLRLPDFGVVSRMRGSMEHKLRIALEGDVWVDCSCPAQLYQGFRYMGTELDYSISKENRPPVIRNPQMKGSVCKHLYRVLDGIELMEPDMARMLDAAKDHKWGYVPVQ